MRTVRKGRPVRVRAVIWNGTSNGKRVNFKVWPLNQQPCNGKGSDSVLTSFATEWKRGQQQNPAVAGTGRGASGGPPKIGRVLRGISWAAIVGMFLVLLMGALVTNSGSADGCGDTWPLCDGKWMPTWDVHAIIEFSHRAVTGLVGPLVLVMSIGLWRGLRHRPEARLLAPAAIVFLLVQAALGALAVMWPQPKTVLALHFGISLTAFASVLLLGVLVRQLDQGTTHREKPVTATLRRWVWGATLYVYGVVYSGAYVRHTNSNLACSGWPLCNDALIPELGGPVPIQMAHRLAALLAALVLVWVWRLAKEQRTERPDIYRAANLALGLVLVQIGVGGLVVLSHLAMGAVMLHSAVITTLFGVLSYLCMQVLAEPATTIGAVAPDELRPSVGTDLG